MFLFGKELNLYQKINLYTTPNLRPLILQMTEMAEKAESILHIRENMVGKGENDRYQNDPFLTIFSKALVLRVVKDASNQIV